MRDKFRFQVFSIATIILALSALCGCSRKSDMWNGNWMVDTSDNPKLAKIMTQENSTSAIGKLNIDLEKRELTLWGISCEIQEFDDEKLIATNKNQSLTVFVALGFARDREENQELVFKKDGDDVILVNNLNLNKIRFNPK